MYMKPMLSLKDSDLEIARLHDEEKLTFSEIGKKFNKSPNRIYEIYKHTKRIQSILNKIDKNDPDITFKDIAAKYLPMTVWKSLSINHKLYSKEVFLAMSYNEIMKKYLSI